MIRRLNPYLQQILVMIVFIMLSIWLLGFLFDPTLFQYINPSFDLQNLTLSTLSAHILGFIVSIMVINSPYKARKFIRFSTITLVLSALIIFFLDSPIIILAYLLSSFLSSGFLVSMAYYLKHTILKQNRTLMMATILVVTNLGLFVIEELTLLTNEWIAIIFAFSMLSLSSIGSFYLKPIHFKMDVLFNHSKKLHEHTKRDLIILSLLIVIITINGGLMYQVIVPSYYELGDIVNHIWLWPYMFGVIVYLYLISKLGKSSILIISMVMLGFAFVGYLIAPINLASFFIIIFLLMSALGLLDLFWWGTMSSMLDETPYPGVIFGGGLLANVLGVSIGIFLSVFIVNSDNVSIFVVSVAFTSIIIVLGLVPFMNHLLSNKSRLQSIFTESKNKPYSKDPVLISLINTLTDREYEVTMKLLQGKTYKMIGAEMHLSVNTIKFHIKAIYEKFEVSSRFDLLLLFDEQ